MRFFPPVALVHLLGCISQSLHDFPGDSVPVIDVSPILLHVSSKQDLMDCVAAIDRALSVYGAFVAIGVPGVDEEAAMKASAALFSSDQAALNEVKIRKGGFMRGYIPFGQESGLQTHFEPKEGFSYGFSWPQGSEGQMSNALHGDNVWPADYHGRHVLENLFTNEIRFAEKLTECISMALNKGNRSALSSYVDPEGSTSVMRLFHYFSASEFKESAELFGKTVMGSSPHTDWGYLTLILQDDVGGLQLRHNDAWIDVPYVANSLVVNGGDFLHVLSGGLYRSPVHRVLSPVTRGRTSLCSFTILALKHPWTLLSLLGLAALMRLLR